MQLPPDPPKAGAPEWMVTFADLMSLLLTFFVLLLSFANMEVVKFKTAVGSIKNALGLRSELDLSDTPTGEELLEHFNEREGQGGPLEISDAELAQQLKEMLDLYAIQTTGEAKVDKEGVTMQLSGDLFFDSGRATLNEAALPVLDKLAEFMASNNRAIDIVGHTDNVPIETPLFPSNWELSAARAGQAVRYLVNRGVAPERLRAIGMADTDPIASNDTPEGRAMNRRIEFIFTARSRRSGDDPDQAAATAQAPAGGFNE